MSSMICGKCARSLPESEFDFKDKAAGRRRSQCKQCVREYSRQHYEANKAEYIARAKVSNVAIREKKREFVQELRSGPCVDCGQTFPACCMEFDHRQGRTITGKASPESIANLTRSTDGLSKIIEELEKCDLLCANCHAIRTHERRLNGYSG